VDSTKGERLAWAARALRRGAGRTVRWYRENQGWLDAALARKDDF
jgi:hypothetical protein